MGRCGIVFTLVVAFVSASAGCAYATTPKLTVARILQDGRRGDVTDVTLRALDGRVLQRGLRQGQVLPNDVRVEVPSDDTVSIAAPNGRDSLTLHPNSSDFFHYTGTQETISVRGGKTDVDDTYGFFSHVNGAGGIVATAPTDPVFSIEVGSTSETVSCSVGSVNVTQTGTSASTSSNGPSASQATAYVKRVDALSRAARSSITYSLGTDVTAEVSLAQDESAAVRGDANAEYNVGSRYYYGQGVTRNYATALHWFQLAAAQDLSVAQAYIGYMYDDGVGVAQSYPIALQWYQLAAAQGNAYAQTNIGYMYKHGHGVAQNYAAALHWFQLAAAQGLAGAQGNIGSMYEHGYGVAQNYATALHWYQLAAAQGNADAKAAVQRVQQLIRH